ncbi:MAG: 2-oxoacid:acceptor oxidoreductase family protein, partial [Muribaculaceae bacterium]|nr:2-oxoacid:acceptor oxidoreductase family protein [Muribaculaceae bacterium]
MIFEESDEPLEVDNSFIIQQPHTVEAIFYGMGADGTVGATKQAAHIIGDSSARYAQAYFSYSAKKSGGYTISQLRVSDNYIRSEYDITHADYVGCNKDTYVNRFPLLLNLRDCGTFVLNCRWGIDELEQKLPATLKRTICRKHVRFYTVDAAAIAEKAGLGVRINTIMQTVFFKLCPVIPFDQAVTLLKEQIKQAYMHEGGEIVDKNIAVVDQAAASIVEVSVPESWADAREPVVKPYGWQLKADARPELAAFVRDIAGPCISRRGDSIPVSKFAADGHMPMGTTAFEKRRIAVNVPRWISEKCVQCTECSFVCPHAAIRPFLLSADEKAAAPEGLATIPFKEGKIPGLSYRIQNFSEDCTGCGSCATVCPGHALEMTPAAPEIEKNMPLVDYCLDHITPKTAGLPRFTLNGSQMHKPLLEFSGACAGCGETPYVKLLTQLFGERLLIANATGCSSIWGANYPSNAYCTLPDGRGPAWGNSLFEDNAEYG